MLFLSSPPRKPERRIKKLSYHEIYSCTGGGNMQHTGQLIGRVRVHRITNKLPRRAPPADSPATPRNPKRSTIPHRFGKCRQHNGRRPDLPSAPRCRSGGIASDPAGAKGRRRARGRAGEGTARAWRSSEAPSASDRSASGAAQGRAAGARASAVSLRERAPETAE